VFVSEPSSSCDHPQRIVLTGLGKVERGIVAYLASTPGRGGDPYKGGDQFPGFDAWWVRTPEGGFARTEDGEMVYRHGWPLGVTVRQIAEVVYGVAEPTAAQTRAVQRAVRHLEALGLADVWHGSTGTRAYTTKYGLTAHQPVPVLYVSLTWRCPHLGNVAA
jgi:hypothetical protein